MQTPSQIRAIDPLSHRRFSDVYNLKSRILTNGEDVIIHPSKSFLLDTEKTSPMVYDSTSGGLLGQFFGYSGKITISEGLVIKDNVLIHINEETEINLNEDKLDYFVEQEFVEDEINNPLFLFLQYNYKKTYPPQKANYVLIRDLGVYEENESNYLYLGYFLFDENGEIESSSKDSYYSEFLGKTLRRNELATFDMNIQINGGVLTESGWFEDWNISGN